MFASLNQRMPIRFTQKCHRLNNYISLCIKDGVYCIPSLNILIKAIVSEGFQHGAASLLSKAGHPVVLAASFGGRFNVHRVGRVDGRVLVEVVVRPEQDSPSVADRHRVGNVLRMRNVKEASGHPGNQVLQKIRPQMARWCYNPYVIFFGSLFAI